MDPKEKEIRERLSKEFQVTFWNKTYDGPFVAEGLVRKFKVAIGKTPYANWGCSLQVAKKLIATADDDLTFLDVGIIINLIVNVPYELFDFNTDEDAIDYMLELEEMKNDFNARVDKINVVMNKKLERMLELAGLTKTVPFIQGTPRQN